MLNRFLQSKRNVPSTCRTALGANSFTAPTLFYDDLLFIPTRSVPSKRYGTSHTTREREAKYSATTIETNQGPFPQLHKPTATTRGVMAPVVRSWNQLERIVNTLPVFCCDAIVNLAQSLILSSFVVLGRQQPPPTLKGDNVLSISNECD